MSSKMQYWQKTCAAAIILIPTVSREKIKTDARCLFIFLVFRKMSHSASSAVCFISTMSLFMSLNRLQVTRNSPTLPEMSSFAKNSKKSVTLSRTATLQGGREKPHSGEICHDT